MPETQADPRALQSPPNPKVQDVASIRLIPARSMPMRAFSLVGEHSQRCFVSHVGLLSADTDCVFDANANVYHMSPPFNSGEMAVHVAGWLETLTRDERDGMLTWIADVSTRISPSVVRQYIIHPPYEPLTCEEPGRTSGWRFSCVGLVLKCYREGANIALLDLESDKMPLVDLGTIEHGYPGVRTSLLAKLGLPGPGPWRVVLPGYVFHSLGRRDEEIRRFPYVPRRPEESQFPS